LLGGEQNSVIR